MREIDVRLIGLERVICCFEVDGVLVDPGPESCVDTLVAALGDAPPPRALLLTHIHFDHAGAAGALVDRWPELPVYVHARGARHLADPERLVASATRLYGEEDMRRLWGEVVPVPEGNLRVLEGGERVLDDYLVEYAPGHASHHVAYLHEPSGRAFVGDMGGVRLMPSTHTMAPTPPPDVDVEAWERSLEVIAAWSPASLGLTHFGAVESVPEQLDAVRTALHHQAELAATHDQDGFVDVMRSEIEREAPDSLPSYLRAAPPDQLFLGLDRWRSKLAR